MIKTSCPGCGHAYRVGDDKAGRKFRCRECGKVCTVPLRKSASQVSSRRQRGTSSSRSEKPQRSNAGTRRKSSASSGYDDYELYDDGYEEYEPYRSAYEDDYTPRYTRRPAARRKTRKSKPGKTRRPAGSSVSFVGEGVSFLHPLIWLGFPVIGWSLAVLLFLVTPLPGLLLMVGLVVAGFGLFMIGSLIMIVKAFMEDIVCGLLYVFVPGYPLYYLLSRWEDQKRPFCMTMCGSFLLAGILAGLPFVLKVRDAERRRHGVGTVEIRSEAVPRNLLVSHPANV